MICVLLRVLRDCKAELSIYVLGPGHSSKKDSDGRRDGNEKVPGSGDHYLWMVAVMQGKQRKSMCKVHWNGPHQLPIPNPKNREEKQGFPQA